MNTLFWIIVTGLVLLALAMIIVPLLKKTAQIDDDHQQRNIDIARQRLKELKQQLHDGVMSQQQFDEHYLELQAMLNDDLQDAVSTRGTASQGRWIIPILAVMIPSISLFLYQLQGETNALRKAEVQQADAQAAANIEAMVNQLQQRLSQQPDDVEGWLMLGRSYSYLQQYQNAADVYAELYRRKADDVDIIVEYANNLAMARSGQMAGEPAQLIEKALKISPDNANALWLAGMAKVEQGKPAEAATLWHKLLNLLPPDSEALPQVRQLLASVEQAPVTVGGSAKQVNIDVQVEIEPALKAKFDPQKTVFIYAQAMNGSKMPLAIVRKQLAELPVKVALNDGMAMQGSSRLSDHQQLRIVARVSNSGKAVPESGDLIGSAELKQPFGTQPVTVLINQEVK